MPELATARGPGAPGQSHADDVAVDDEGSRAGRGEGEPERKREAGLPRAAIGPGNREAQGFIARHVGVATAAHGDIQRWPRSTGIRQSLTEADILDEALRAVHVLDAAFRVAPPHAVAIDLDLFR